MPANRLLEKLALRRLDDGSFGAGNIDLGRQQVYGGQMISQIMAAAYETVDDKPAKSVHVDFLAPGDPGEDVNYTVETVSGGRTEHRVVRASQGRLCALATVGFAPLGDGVEHQVGMPSVPPPDALPRIERIRGRAFVAHGDPSPFSTHALPPELAIWFRLGGPLPDADRPNQILLGYAADLTLMLTAFLPVPDTSADNPERTISATTSHTMWFHRPVRWDGWLLHHQRTAIAHAGRALTTGHWFDEEGRLVASCAQEGVSRLRR